MTYNNEQSWKAYVHELKDKPLADRTDNENYTLLFADIMELYQGIKEPSDITKELEEHYYGIKDKDLTAIHREIYELSEEDRKKDYSNPCRPGKMFLKEKGDVIDKLCEILEIKKQENFHSQLKKKCIYEEDVLNSEWYFHVIRYKDEIEQIFRLEINKDFKDNSLKYFKKFCFKVMGISCSLEQHRGLQKWEEEPLFKQHKREDIYRKHYGGTPRGDTKKRQYSDDWIDRKIKNGDVLTTAEQKFRARRRHVAIHHTQPRYRGYLSGVQNSILQKLKMNHGIKNNKQKGGIAR